MNTSKKQSFFFKNFFVCFLFLNLTLLISGCSDNSISETEEVEEIGLFASDKLEEPDQDDRE